MVLDSQFRPQTCTNLWKCTFAGIDQIVYRYWRNRLPVLAKSYTGIGEIVFWYWPNRILAYLGWSNFVLSRKFLWKFLIDLQNKMKTLSLQKNTKYIFPGYPADITGRSGYLLQIDYWKWNFPITQSVCWSVRRISVLNIIKNLLVNLAF